MIQQHWLKPQLQKLNEQIDKWICKIKNGIIIGTGYFCKIPLNTNNLNFLPLITCNHALDQICIENGKIINLIYRHAKYSLFIDNSRKVYTNSREEKI